MCNNVQPRIFYFYIDSIITFCHENTNMQYTKTKRYDINPRGKTRIIKQNLRL